ncbi:MAG: nucleotidyltransferase domain-containing protein [Anaeroplasmataceae bacterium]
MERTLDTLKIPKEFIERIKIIKTIILEVYPTSEILLFGSCAKGVVREDSDIDLIILLDSDYTRMDRVNLRAAIDIKTNYELEFDLKLYTKEKFNKYKTTEVFENSIYKDSIDITI